MCTGINFNPLYGMLDPRYCPPEELVMPQSESRGCCCCCCWWWWWQCVVWRVCWAPRCSVGFPPKFTHALHNPPSPPNTKAFPRAPPPAVAALLSPVAWLYGRPDLFDSYSAGVLLMQMAVPQLRSSASIRQFNGALRGYDYDLDEWRAYGGRGMDFELLDRARGAGWDLARRLICKRGDFNRGRLSVDAALRHRFFLPELF